MSAQEFRIPEFGISAEQDARIMKKLEEVAATVKGENSFFQRIELQDIVSDAYVFFVEGKAQREFKASVVSSKTNGSSKALEWHFYAFLSRAFRNRMEDIYPSKYSTVKSARVRPGDNKELSSRKAFASGVGPNISLDSALGDSDEGGSRSTAHEIFGTDSTEDLSTTVDRMRTLAVLEQEYPVLFARLLDAVKNPSEVTSSDGSSLNFRQRIESAIHGFHQLLGDNANISAHEFEDLESELIQMMKGWRAVRGNYRVNKQPVPLD